MMNDAAQKIVSFLTTNNAAFPKSVIQKKCGLDDAAFKKAWSSLKKEGKVVTLQRDKKYWHLA